MTNRRLLKYLLRDLPKGQRRWLFGGLLLALTTALSTLGLVAAAGWLITACALAGAAGGAVMTVEIFFPGALIRFFAVSRTVSRYLERLVVHEAVFRILGRLRQALFTQQMQRPFASLSGLRDGPLLTRLMVDVERLEHFHAGLLLPLSSFFTAVLLLALTAWIVSGATAAMVILLLGVGVLLLMIAFMVQHGRRDASLALAQARANTRLHDLLAAHRELQFADPSEQNLEQWLDQASSHRQEEKNLADGAARNDSRIQLLFSLGLVGLTLISTHSAHVQQQATALPWWVLVLLGLVALAGLATGLVPALRRWAMVRVAAHRLAPATRTSPSINSPMAAQGERHGPVAWQLEGVTLARGLSDRPVLDWVNLQLPAGERWSIVGDSGAGKSRLAALLVGALSPDGGRVLMDGEAMSHWPEAARFARVALLEQRSVILAGSLADNLRLGNPELDRDRMIRALQATGLSEAGLTPETRVGEMDRTLSGGEARRVALIRTVFCDTPTLILDEPFRGLDRGSIDKVSDWLVTETRGRGLILLDHRHHPALCPHGQLRLRNGGLERT
ncbi:ATP-binding cassette domain-containing protein [Gammaproteobacteria bacterium AB-CW1]|uniref:ATP-binding cassette domain-containing protein n=1 Tax=Natronospira elongata TaxID=3110268 RepID=A0AAP6MJA2_9GAMM|nr:ATP-binding cassette domain-containing protein [Gammaproteobacteria bacterium AB-CW1]